MFQWGYALAISQVWIRPCLEQNIDDLLMLLAAIAQNDGFE